MMPPRAALPAELWRLSPSQGRTTFHGNVYEFFRNDALNANNFFLNRAGIPRPPYKRNQFGGTLGGPVVKDRMWFFVSYQGSRERNATSLTNSIGTVFVPQNLSNDRSDAGVDAFAASYGLAPCATTTYGIYLPSMFRSDGQVSASGEATKRLLRDSIGSQSNGGRLGAVPQPVAAPVVGISKFREDQFNTNLDFNLSSANRLSAKFFAANNPATEALFNLFGLGNALPVPGFGGKRES